MESRESTVNLCAYFPVLNSDVFNLLTICIFLFCCYYKCISHISIMTVSSLWSYVSGIEIDLRRITENPSIPKKNIICPWKRLEWSVLQRSAGKCTTAEKVDFIIILVLNDMFHCRKESIYLNWLSIYICLYHAQIEQIDFWNLLN